MVTTEVPRTAIQLSVLLQNKVVVANKEAVNESVNECTRIQATETGTER